MTAQLERTAATPDAWRIACTTIYRAGEALIADGKEVRASVCEHDNPLTLRQLRFIHGPILQQISDQVRVNGVQFTKEAWKVHLKDLFIPDEWEMRQVPFVRDLKTGKWRPSRRRVPVKKDKSLKDLGVKRCSEFIDKVLAHAAIEWGVEFVFTFDEREQVRYRPAARRARQAEVAPV